ncbi:MAG: two-component regulator propeller domain-containing protein [Bacteroidales bacterium]
MKHIQALFFILFLIATSIKAQIIPNKNLTVNDGLPSSEVYNILQDKKGFIWLATDKGVSMYDGYKFTNYSLEDNLPRVTVFELFEDNAGRIWCITASGELAFFKNQKLNLYKYNDIILKNKSRSQYPVKKSFYADSLNNVYISFECTPIIHIDSLGKVEKIGDYNNKALHIEYINPESENVLFTSFSISKNPDVNLVVNKHDHNQFKVTTNIKRLPQGIRTIAIPYFDKTIFSTNKDLLVIDSIGKTKQYTFDKNIFWISKDSKDLIWLGFENGGAKAYKGTNFSKEIYNLLPHKSVSSVICDHNGAYWLTTLTHGIYYFPILDMKIYSKGSGLLSSNIRQVENANGKIWFAGASRYYYSFYKGHINKFKVNRTKLHECRNITAFGDSILFSFHGSYSNFSFLKVNNKIVQSSNKIYLQSAFKSHEGDIYVTLNGVYLLQDSILKKRYANNKFSRIYDSKNYNNKIVYLGTNYGLFSFNTYTKEIKELSYSNLLKSRVNCLHIDRNKNVWIGTKGKGLILLKDTIAKHISLHKVLGNSVSSIKRIKNTLWISANNGIAKAKVIESKDSIYLQKITRIPGLFDNEINDLAIDSTNVYAASNSGLIVFKQDFNSKSPQTYITKIKINGKTQEIKKDYNLKSYENNIEISFVGLNYLDAKHTKYAYKLEGIDDNWIYTQNTSVQYPSLQAGNYTFKVKAINYQGIETETPIQLGFFIQKAYYDTLWFKITVILSFLLIGSLIALIVLRIKFREERKRLALTQNMNLYKQQALSAQMNPHFIHNSLNSIQSYILKNDRVVSSKFLSLFSRLIRKILENSQNQFISLKEEIDALQLYIELELIRFNHSFDFDLYIDKKINLREINVPPLILQPYAENAIHHGLRHKKENDGVLSINITTDNNHIIIKIKDNGIGREKAKEIKQRKTNTYKSLGMEITNKRINLVKTIYKNQISAVIIDEFKRGNISNGTTVVIKINKN